MEFLELQLFEPIISFRFQSLLVSSAGGSVLTLIAVLAAAVVGFWRIKIGGSKDCESDDAPILTTGSPEEANTQQKAAPLVRSTETEETSVSPSCSDNRLIEIVGTPKIRFTTYFEEEDFIGCCHVEDEEELEPVPEVVCKGFCQRKDAQLPRKSDELDDVKWESMAVSRRGDLGWYSYQDMAALNGNVVRLWDGDISPRRRIKGSFVIPSFRGWIDQFGN